MTPEERELIAGLFERMRNMGAIEKDREAEDLIARSARQVPDAIYMLVQSVLVQEQALQQAGARIEELEGRLSELERNETRPSGAGSFLGGIFGGGREETPHRGAGSVPSIGSRAGGTPSGFGRSPAWPQRSDAYGYGQAGEGQRGGGGSFLRGAMATAAGVAGGMLLADSIRGMLGGEAGKAQAAPSDSKAGTNDAASPYEVNQPEQKGQSEQPQYQDPNDNDPGNYEDASWGGGGDEFGGDIDI